MRRGDSAAARRWQSFGKYMTAAVVFGLLSLLVTVPLGGLAEYGLTRQIAGQVIVDQAGFLFPLSALLMQTGVAEVAPQNPAYE